MKPQRKTLLVAAMVLSAFVGIIYAFAPGSRSAPPAAAPFRNYAYVWQTRWSDAVARAVHDATTRFDALAVLAAAPPDAFYARWVNSKLLLQEGKVDASIALLERLTTAAPDIRMPAGVGAPPFWDSLIPRNEIYSELGILLLGRKDYIKALDAFLRSRAWNDAAYVAERVLTPEELERFIGSVGSDPELNQTAYETFLWSEGDKPGYSLVDGLRHLLGRRLADRGDWFKAAEYLPDPERDVALKMVTWLAPRGEHEEKREAALRYMTAARTLYSEGLVLVGTELEPDYKFSAGRLPYGNACERRAKQSVPAAVWGDARVFMEYPDVWESLLTSTTSALLVASDDEVRRIKKHAPTPDRRYHYRFKAADLMWKAAQLLPDNDELTAEALYLGGTYIAKRDAEAADRFYKDLVTRCRKLPIGQEADRLRWFPKSFAVAEERASFEE